MSRESISIDVGTSSSALGNVADLESAVAEPCEAELELAAAEAASSRSRLLNTRSAAT